MSDNKMKCELWNQIKDSRGICDVYDLGLAQDVFAECWDTRQFEINLLKQENEKLRQELNRFMLPINDEIEGSIDRENWVRAFIPYKYLRIKNK